LIYVLLICLIGSHVQFAQRLLPLFTSSDLLCEEQRYAGAQCLQRRQTDTHMAVDVFPLVTKRSRLSEQNHVVWPDKRDRHA